jgi:hypothetical protein
MLLSAMKTFRSQMFSRLQRGEITTEQASELTQRHKQMLMQRIPQHMRHRMTQYTRVDATSPSSQLTSQSQVQSTVMQQTHTVTVIHEAKTRHVNTVTPEHQTVTPLISGVAPSTVFHTVSAGGALRGN